MKRRYIPILVAVVLSSVAATSCKNAEAQVNDNNKLYYPLAFGDDTLNLRQDKMTRVYIPPKKVLWSQGNVHDLENLLNADDGQADLVNASSCYMKSTNEEGASIILDYGRELHGALKLVVGSGSAADFKMRIRLGESVSETCSEISGGTATNDHATRDMILTVPRYGQIETGNSGFRFACIDLLGEASLNLK